MSTLRALPQVDELIRTAGLAGTVGPVLARVLAREAIDEARTRARRGESIDPEAVRRDVLKRAETVRRLRLRRVVNATGVILHTNLGRAPLSPEAVAAVAGAAGSVNLEMDLEDGVRAVRAPLAARLLCALTGSESALVVNNNAGALVLALAALARGRDVIVSRGELIEIGGGFRLPEVMQASGAVLREVGTTNRTRSADVRAAIGEQTALVLVAHPSNFRVVGFTESPALSDVAAIAHEAGIFLLYDLGSGLLQPEPALPGEPDAATALRDGADLVCFSGDKLLGGPQAGILAGRADLVEACRRHPLARALRADKLTLAALEATMAAHARGDRSALPVWRMLEIPVEEIAVRAERLAASIGARTMPGESLAGGGSVPGHGLPTMLVVLDDPGPEAFASSLRSGEPPVMARVESGSLVIDLRTVDPEDDDTLASAIRTARVR